MFIAVAAALQNNKPMALQSKVAPPAFMDIFIAVNDFVLDLI